MHLGGDWSGQQLAEFLATVSSFPHEAAAVATGVESIAQAVEAEVGAVVCRWRVVASIGFPRGRVPDDELCAVTTGDRPSIDVPGAGECRVLCVPMEDDGPSFVVLARSGEDFSKQETALVRAMAGVLCLAVRMLRTLEAERGSRERSERQAEENAGLLSSLQERQDLLERLFRIQRSISHRAPISEVLDAITEGAAELLGDDVVGLRLVDPEDPSMLVMVSSRGMDDELTRTLARTSINDGVGGLVATAGRLVVTHDYPGLVHPLEPLVADGLRAAMGAPVFQDGKPIGSLVVASRSSERRYDAAEQEMLLAFAEHASLALNDASAVDAMRKAFADAVHQRTTTRSPGCRTAPSCSTGSAWRSPGGAATAPRSACCSSTWTASRRSTTPSGTRWATRSSCGWASACWTRCGPTTRSGAWPATSSWSCASR